MLRKIGFIAALVLAGCVSQKSPDTSGGGDVDIASALTSVWMVCESAVDPSVKVGACTTAIQSGELDETALGWAYNNRGVGYARMGRNADAISDFSEAIRMLPQRFVPYSNRGALYTTMERYDLALQDLNRSIDIFPEDTFTLRNRGEIYLRLGDFDRSIEDLQVALPLLHQMSGEQVRSAEATRLIPLFDGS
jgi:tetratricopeptide (TPR) repeat protein